MLTFADLSFGGDPTSQRVRRAVLTSIEDSIWKEPTAVQMDLRCGGQRWVVG